MQATWLDRVPPDDAAEILALRDRHQRGELSYSAATLARSIKKCMGLTVTWKTIATWLAQKKN